MSAAVLITGGGSGIGRAIAERVVARGARAILWDISEPALAETCAALGAKAVGHVVDVADKRAVAQAGAALSDQRVTHLVNNAGILGHAMGWAAINPAEVSRVMAINVVAMMQVTYVFIQTRHAHPQAAIVNLSSIAGENGGAPGFAAYGASKGAILALTRAMARDFAPDVRVNALAPGIIDTPIQDAVMTAPNARETAAASIPLGRLGTAQEVAEAADWLLFHAPYATGEVHRIAGGRR